MLINVKNDRLDAKYFLGGVAGILFSVYVLSWLSFPSCFFQPMFGYFAAIVWLDW